MTTVITSLCVDLYDHHALCYSWVHLVLFHCVVVQNVLKTRWWWLSAVHPAFYGANVLYTRMKREEDFVDSKDE